LRSVCAIAAGESAATINITPKAIARRILEVLFSRRFPVSTRYAAVQ
jgi:hypothetical protein